MMEFFKARNNLIGFDDGIIEELQKETLIEKISMSNDKGNDYYKIKGVDNVIFMHVSGGYGILIPERIEWNGCTYNFVDEICKYRWNIYGDNKISATSIKNLLIHRAMWSLALYGDILERMDGHWHVHHKSYRWWNDLDATVVVCKRKHFNFHKRNGGSHQGGIYFKRVDEFTTFIAELDIAKKMVKRIKM